MENDSTKIIKTINQKYKIQSDPFKFKEFEFQTQLKLDLNKITIIRLDGIHFHSFTQPFLSPFDPYLHYCLEQSLLELLNINLKGYSFLVYFQSDEASIILPHSIDKKEFPYRGRIEKIRALFLQWNVYFYAKLIEIFNSIMPFFPSLRYSLYMIDSSLKKDDFWSNYKHQIRTWIYSSRPSFDFKGLQVDSMKNVLDYLLWRRMDAIRNFKNKLGQKFYSHQMLQGLSANQILSKIEHDHPTIKYSKIPNLMKRGIVYYNDLNKPWLENDGFNKNDEETQIYQETVINLMN
jgi:tRNA(His) 5'-end guanylyltransferase